MKILDVLAHIAILLVFLVGIFAAFVPSLLPVLNAFSYACILAAIYLIPRRCYLLLSSKTVRTATALLSFSLLYLSVILGFASTYHLIRDDFVVKDAPGRDVALDELIARWETLKSGIPEKDERARVEYEKWEKLQSEIASLEYLIREILARKLRPPEERRPPFSATLPDDPQPFIQELEALRNKQKAFDAQLLTKHRDFLAAVALARQAQEEITRYSYLSFVYFSTVTIATVGYGDITPKRIRAKMLVTAQILLGGALVLVYLTLVLNRPQAAPGAGHGQHA